MLCVNQAHLYHEPHVHWNSSSTRGGGGGGIPNIRPPLVTQQILAIGRTTPGAGETSRTAMQGHAQGRAGGVCGGVCTSVFGSLDPPPTPIISEATDTRPSFAPRTPVATGQSVLRSERSVSWQHTRHVRGEHRVRSRADTSRGGATTHNAHLLGAIARAVSSAGWRRSGHRRGRPPRRPPPPPLLQARKEALPASPLGWRADCLQGRRHLLGAPGNVGALYTTGVELHGGMTGT